jgi:alkanesulfonate monooxygenase SsuD/methylene tetrahydromethanopterin reductase-like flavin-dependent oxidoreductase (luciferase family)
MRLGVATFLSEYSNDPPRAADRLLALGRKTEEMGFHGFWVGDAQGRGAATLDPLAALTAVAAVTRKIELAVGVLQVPLRDPVELAQRVQSLNVLSQGRFRFGVGAGSTRADFDLLGRSFETRFATLLESTATMRRAWRGEKCNNGVLTPWPGYEDGPPILIGAWHSARWIKYAAEQCSGWIASGLFSKWNDAAEGIKAYRAAGGQRAILTNVPFDTRKRPGFADEFAETAQISLVGTAAAARDKLRRIEDLGFDDVILVPPDADAALLDMIPEFASVL